MNFNPLNQICTCYFLTLLKWGGCIIQNGKPKEHKEEDHGWVICGFADNIEKIGELFDEG